MNDCFGRVGINRTNMRREYITEYRQSSSYIVVVSRLFLMRIYFICDWLVVSIAAAAAAAAT